MRSVIAGIWLIAAATIVGPSVAAQDAGGKTISCTCRYAGQSFDVNAQVCILTASAGRMARCDQVLNNSSWTFTGDACPLAGAPHRSPTA